ncbi:serum response factor blistered [Glossina fuscipes fuscipes]
MDPSRGDSRYNLNYSMSSIGLTLADQADMYGNPPAVAVLSGRPPSAGLLQSMSGGASGVGLGSRTAGGLMSGSPQCQSLTNSGGSHGQHGQQRGMKRAGSDCYDDHHRSAGAGMSSLQALENCGASGQHSAQQQQQQQQQSQQQSTGGTGVSDVIDDSYNSLQNKKSPPANGKKTKGRVKIKMEYIDNKLRRYTTFSKRKTGIMKKAYELSTLTGTQVMLLVASETGHVYTFATRKLQPMITSEAGKQLIQTCLNSPDPPSVGGGDQRMSATGFEETELSYNIADEDSKDDRSPVSSGNESDDSSEFECHTATDGRIGTDKSSNLDNNLENKNNADVSIDEKKCFGQGMDQDMVTVVGGSRQNQCTAISTAPEKKFNPNPATESMFYSASALSNVPQDVLLQLIQSGHLQVHTEEDGSGHQYVAIPLSPSTMNLLQSAKPSLDDGSKKQNDNLDLGASTSSNQVITPKQAVIVKQEFE